MRSNTVWANLIHKPFNTNSVVDFLNELCKSLRGVGKILYVWTARGVDSLPCPWHLVRLTHSHGAMTSRAAELNNLAVLLYRQGHAVDIAFPIRFDKL